MYKDFLHWLKTKCLPFSVFHLIKTYKHHWFSLEKHLLPNLLKNLIKTTKNLLATRKKTILVYPNPPRISYVLYNICLHQGYRIGNDPNRHFDVSIKWQDITLFEIDSSLSRLSVARPIVNLNCRDISKEQLEKVSERVFGYTAAVDPLVYQGNCVIQSNLNARHNGRIISCPISATEPDYVYEKIINNQVEGNLVLDLRVQIFRNTIPFVYLKYRPIEDRFSNQNHHVDIAKVQDIFSESELELILDFCEEMGLDYGELDILRDRNDGLLYIVDVNNTPYGPPNHLSESDRYLAIHKLSQVFQEVFLESDWSKQKRPKSQPLSTGR